MSDESTVSVKLRVIVLIASLAFVAFMSGRLFEQHEASAPATNTDGYQTALDDCRFELRIAKRRCFAPDDLAPRIGDALRRDGWLVGEAECKGCDPGFTMLVMRRHEKELVQP